jgi:hypothetical protein
VTSCSPQTLRLQQIRTVVFLFDTFAVYTQEMVSWSDITLARRARS